MRGNEAIALLTPPNHRKTLVVVPALNESACIVAVVRAVRGAGYPCLVVDDGSIDATAVLAIRAGADEVVRSPVNRGIGYAMSLAFIFAIRNGYDAVVRIDGDGQHNVTEIPKLLRVLESGEIAAAVGSRFSTLRSFRPTYARRLGIWLISKIQHALTGLRVRDATSGFRAYARPAFERLVATPKTRYSEPVELVHLQRAGFGIVEVPVRMHERQGGRSSIGLWDSASYVVRVVWGMMAARLGTDSLNVR